MELTAEKLGVRRGAILALEDVALQLPSGTHALVLGGPASGKTTLLKALTGLVPATLGDVRWDGTSVRDLSEADRRKAQAAFGMVFQTDALFDSIDVLENVLLPLRKRRVPESEALDRAHGVLAQVGLTEAARRMPEQLSGGMKKRVGIARALVAAPRVLLADDPLAGLDPRTAREVCELLLRVAEGRTLLVTQPDPVAMLPLPRWLVLSRGRLVHDGPPRPDLLLRALTEAETVHQPPPPTVAR